jgi:hypothetical protein
MSTELQTAPKPKAALPALAEADEQRLSRLAQWAVKLASSSLCPVHLIAKPDNRITDEGRRNEAAWKQTNANCLLVANQAERWQADVFAVAGESYVVGNKLSYQGKLVAAMINKWADLKHQVEPIYGIGKGDDLACVVFGSRVLETIPDEAYPLLESYADHEDRKALRALSRMGVLAVRISVGQAKTSNDMWRKDPEQKLWYSGVTKWARRYSPEVILGVMTDDDVDRMQMQVNDEYLSGRAAKSLDQLLPPLPPTQDVEVTSSEPTLQTNPEPAPDARVVSSPPQERAPAGDSTNEPPTEVPAKPEPQSSPGDQDAEPPEAVFTPEPEPHYEAEKPEPEAPFAPGEQPSAEAMMAITESNASSREYMENLEERATEQQVNLWKAEVNMHPKIFLTHKKDLLKLADEKLAAMKEAAKPRGRGRR